MKKISLFSLLVLLVAGAVTLNSCQGTKNSTASKMLSFGLEKGKAYDYETIMSMDQEIMGQKMTMDLSTYYSMSVTEEEQASRTIATSIDRFKMKTSVAGFNIEIDSDKPLSSSGDDEISKSLGQVNKLFAAFKGQRFNVKVDAEGKILEVSGTEEMAKKLMDSLDLPPAEKEKALQEFSKTLGDEQIKSSLERFWYIFPNKQVKVGDSWQKNNTVSGGSLPGNYNSTYKVTDIEGDMVTIDETTKIDGVSNEGGKETKMKGEITGTVVIDSRSGLVVNADQDIKMNASAEGMNFTIKAKSKIKGTAR